MSYRAVRNADGTYNIYDVEIMVPYYDEKLKPSSISDMELPEFVDTFEDDKNITAQRFGENKNYLPRVHVQHHEDQGYENREGAGFLDNLRVRNSILYTDLVRVPEKIVLEIQQGKYPYRSVEFVGVNEKRILSLALLESREPYIKLPMLDDLELVKMQVKQQRQVLVQNYDMKLNFQGDKMKLIDISAIARKYGVPEDRVVKFMNDYAENEMPSKFQDDELAQVIERVKLLAEKNPAYKPALDCLMGAPAQPVAPQAPAAAPTAAPQQPAGKMQDDPGEEDDEKKIKLQEDDAPEDEKINMQKHQNSEIQKLQARLELLERKQQKETELSKYDQSLRSICESSSSLNYDEEREILGSLPAKHRDSYIQKLQATTNRSISVDDDFLISLPNAGDRKSRIEEKLGKAYDATMKVASHDDVRKFQAAYGDKETFVKFCAQKELEVPGYCEKNIFTKLG